MYLQFSSTCCLFFLYSFSNFPLLKGGRSFPLLKGGKIPFEDLCPLLPFRLALKSLVETFGLFLVSFLIFKNLYFLLEAASAPLGGNLGSNECRCLILCGKAHKNTMDRKYFLSGRGTNVQHYPTIIQHYCPFPRIILIELNLN